MLAVAALGFALRDSRRRLYDQDVRSDNSCSATDDGESCLSFNFDDACNNAQKNQGRCDVSCDASGSCDAR